MDQLRVNLAKNEEALKSISKTYTPVCPGTHRGRVGRIGRNQLLYACCPNTTSFLTIQTFDD